MSEDGVVLAGHISSNESFSQYDMGFTSERKHDCYDNKYPDGYDLVWLTSEQQNSNQDFKKAVDAANGRPN